MKPARVEFNFQHSFGLVVLNYSIMQLTDIAVLTGFVKNYGFFFFLVFV